MLFALELSDNLDLTAIATFALALVTVGLAWKTRALAQSGQATAKAAEMELELLREQADAAKRQVEAAEAALNASVAPLLLDVPPHTIQPGPRRVRWSKAGEPKSERTELDVSFIQFEFGEHQQHPWLTVPVRNVGAGVALVGHTYAAYEDSDNPRLVIRGTVPTVIPPDEIRDLVFEWDASQTAWLERLRGGEEILTVEVSYSDISGRQLQATILYLARTSNRRRPWIVRDVLPAVDRRLTA